MRNSPLAPMQFWVDFDVYEKVFKFHQQKAIFNNLNRFKCVNLNFIKVPTLIEAPHLFCKHKNKQNFKVF